MTFIAIPVKLNKILNLSNQSFKNMTTLLVKNISFLVTMDGARREIVNGAIFARDGIIEQVGQTADLPPQRIGAGFKRLHRLPGAD